MLVLSLIDDCYSPDILDDLLLTLRQRLDFHGYDKKEYKINLMPVPFIGENK